MKKYLILLGLPLMVACGGGSRTNTPLEDSLAKTDETMIDEVNNKDSIINNKEEALSAFIKSLNEIQSNLNEIKAKEKIINASTKGSELKKSEKDQIIDDIQFIYNKMEKNRQRLATISKKLKKANMQIDDLETAIANLHVQLTDNETEIENLKVRLEKMSADFKNLNIKYTEAELQSEQKTAMLNTAYYAIGTAKELKEKGIITKEGGFIGIGRTTELKPDLNDANFLKIDITTVTEIPLNGARKVKLVTTHPNDSYKLVETSSYDKLIILDPKKFWEASKYLVIITEK